MTGSIWLTPISQLPTAPSGLRRDACSRPGLRALPVKAAIADAGNGTAGQLVDGLAIDHTAAVREAGAGKAYALGMNGTDDEKIGACSGCKEVGL